MTSLAINQYYCTNCRVAYANCICSKLTALASSYKLLLLTHPRELKKGTNSGFLLTKMLGATIIKWHRNKTQATVLQSIAQENALLVYPKSENARHDEQPNPPLDKHNLKNKTLILLDGTWQECQKMLNQSPWLKTLQRIHIDCNTPSNFDLRRNSRPGTLSTCEAAAQLVKHTEPLNSQALNEAFNAFVEAFSKGRNNQRHKP